ncbi:cupin domain-containing protein [Candidatus Woesearchaeota archaeon]|nr:cupin domain-containing protein [Candidatus Woesearchaeota archaeon]
MQSITIGNYSMFVRNFFERDDESDIIKIITTLNPTKEFSDLLQKEELTQKIIDFNDNQCYIGYKNLNFFKKPRKSSSEHSNAVYLASRKKPFEGYLLQHLPPNGLTSGHRHKITTEAFHILEGKVIMNIDSRETTIIGGSYIVKPRTWHQLKTKEQPALTLIQIIGDPKGLSMDDHWF